MDRKGYKVKATWHRLYNKMVPGCVGDDEDENCKEEVCLIFELSECFQYKFTDDNHYEGQTASSPAGDWAPPEWSPQVVGPQAAVDQDVGEGQENEGDETGAEQPEIKSN